MFNQWILISVLSVSTYLSRIIGLEFLAGKELSPTLRLYFTYVPVGIMSTLILKQIFIPSDGQLILSYPVLIGCIVTAITISKVKIFLPSVVIGIAAGLLSRYLIFG